MPRDGSYRLHEYSGDGRGGLRQLRPWGRLSNARLIAEHGADASPPDLRTKIARCDQKGSMIGPYSAYYVE
jgi:hypothetical protein